MSEQLLVWWTTGEDCNKIGEPMYDEDYESERDEMGWDSVPTGCILMSQLPMPDYIKSEFSLRSGRAGRGRLWIPNDIELPGGIPWGTGPVFDAAERCGGIVFRAADKEEILKLPGFVTDIDMHVVQAEIGRV